LASLSDRPLIRIHMPLGVVAFRTNISTSSICSPRIERARGNSSGGQSVTLSGEQRPCWRDHSAAVVAVAPVPNICLAAGLKTKNFCSLSATMTASPILDKMDWRISLVGESSSTPRSSDFLSILSRSFISYCCTASAPRTAECRAVRFAVGSSRLVTTTQTISASHFLTGFMLDYATAPFSVVDVSSNLQTSPNDLAEKWDLSLTRRHDFGLRVAGRHAGGDGER